MCTPQCHATCRAFLQNILVKLSVPACQPHQYHYGALPAVLGESIWWICASRLAATPTPLCAALCLQVFWWTCVSNLQPFLLAWKKLLPLRERTRSCTHWWHKKNRWGQARLFGVAGLNPPGSVSTSLSDSSVSVSLIHACGGITPCIE